MKLLIGIFILGATISFKSMGFFDKLFGKTKTEKSASKNNFKHDEEWEFYFSNVNDKLASISLDLGLRKIAPINNKSNLVWVFVKMNNPREDGLSSQTEFDKLVEIEDNLVHEISKIYNSIFAGRVTTDGDREFYFYLDNTKNLKETISKIMEKFPNYQFQEGTKLDENWSHYFDFLYPLPEQFQKIQNRKVVDQLENGGDKLIKEREVNHWLYFKTKSDRINFLAKIKNENFNVVEESFDKTFGEFPYSLQIKRINKVDLDSVDEYVIYLWKIANQFNGDYDGWETSIEK
ncbi:DUF695 domain-containing protein [Flavobacterium sp. SM15]|uniref:DUF695 domain-containing protein n=1 Tax=Flavobacterium sp. SM15 TaxID=2908005 RepID=UPI001EDBDA0A|nr:DUF695 domain-containing protein [Flavobacterium sp. SM15]MCG2612007.1 DUF695 domain-containing protein [Flavobacterium sp. SM15]